MTTRTYNLRARAEAPTTAQSMMPNQLDTGPVLPLYSDIAASRPPSPRKEASISPAEPAEHPLEEVDSEGIYGYSRMGAIIDSNIDHTRIDNDISSSENEPPRDPEEQQWITVSRRRAHSLDSGPRIHRISREKKETRTKGLTKEQNQAVKAAVLTMNREQNELVQRRQEKVTANRGNSSPSRGEGPSRPKGKGIDP